MKKQIIISSFAAALLWGATAVAVINNANAKESSGPTEIIAANNTLISPNPIVASSKNETVYVITDESGNPKTKFIGSTIYDGSEELPFTFGVTYYLDGQEISGKDLAGKSGHVKIVYNYTSTARYQGKLIPFLAITGITLDHAKFNNVKVTNGKIINENSDSYMLAGYSLVGVNTDLNIDFLPETFILEADVTDFKLENTYTIFANDFIADFDTSKLADLDSVVNSIYELSDGLNKIVSGSNELTNGLASALDGTKQLYEGSKTLVAKLREGSNKLNTGADAIITSTLTNLNTQIQANEALMAAIQTYGQTLEIEFPLTPTNYAKSIAGIEQLAPAMTASLEQAKGLVDFALGTKAYTENVVGENGYVTQLSNNIGALVEGQTKLYQGSVTLRDGLTTFKTAGIDKLVNFAKKDLSNFTANARATVSAAASYRSYGNVDAKSVKFIVKTPSI